MPLGTMARRVCGHLALPAALGPTIPLVMTSLGAPGLLGKRPRGCPLYMTSVCSSVIWDK